MQVRVATLKPRDRFMWKDDVAVVHDICEFPTCLPEGPYFSLDVEVPTKNFRGAVQVQGATLVEKID